MNFDWIKVRAVTHSDKVAIIEPAKKREWTYHELNVRAENLANYLVEQGVQRGDRVGVFAPNDVAIADFFFACIKMGAVFIPLNWRLKPLEVAKVVEDSGTKFIVNAVNHEDRLENVPKEYIKLNIDLPEYDEIVNPANHRPFESVDLELNDPAFLIYTSGSTGTPKGVLHTHQSYRNNAFNEILSFNLTEELRVIINVPLFHIIGFVDMLIPVLMLGGTIVLERYFNAQTLNSMIREYRPNTLIMIPTMYYAMLASPDFAPDVLESVDLIVSGGAPPLPQIAQAFEKMGKPIMNIYGLSEVPLVTFNRKEFAKENPAAIGQPLMNGKIKIVDDQLEEVGVGEVGELLVAGANVFAGYWNLPEEDEKAFHEGYFRTGDLATRNEKGEITIVNRLKELIITGGENVLPSEVEAILNKHPLIKSGLVVGYDNPKYGESVSAAIILNPEARDYENFEAALDEFMMKNLAGYKVPKLYLVLEEIPLNSVGKPDRLEIQRMMNEYAKEIDDPVNHNK